ncbi:Gfo/Idh/MocA family protein [Rhodopirellula sallentina]|uniref:Oxidoreductase domain-containing protein n=1 Tax=Rhodopirellula sallentina SM41 TaxID=1263870 RepID=M5U924_9BACT|nr:Gfo/Idh/MocA family oxidoreductase [Rhodopirellula sallentina]EMI57764.1 oxidoreductase domain-containing protein [Rhodopirellula sallentina SM41]
MKSNTTRRDFLKTGSALAVGASAPYVITSSALGDRQKPPASDRITVGHIGVGSRGRSILNQVRRVQDAQIVAVSDCYRDRRESIAKVIRGEAYQDFRDLLARDDIDAVVIATPDHWHVPIAIMAAQAGKSAYVEKPLGLSLEQTLACEKTFAEHGVVFQYGTQQRSTAHCHHGCELVRRGAIGKVHTIEVDCPNGGEGGTPTPSPIPDGLDYDMWLGPAPQTPYTVDRCKPPGSYWIYDQSIGYLGGWGAHPLDIMVWGSDADLSGLIEVEGNGEIPTDGLYDCVFNWDMKIKLGDVKMTFRPGADRTKFIGEEGWIEVCRSKDRTAASDPVLLATKLDTEDTQLLVSNHHQGNFIQAVKEKDPTAAVSNMSDAARSDTISHLCDIAVRTGEKIVWDPTKKQLVAPSERAKAMLSREMRGPWTL